MAQKNVFFFYETKLSTLERLDFFKIVLKNIELPVDETNVSY